MTGKSGHFDSTLRTGGSLKEPAGALWFEEAAEKVLNAFPTEDVYTCAAGISPSGTVHFGNFRDVITSLAVAKELQLRGKRVRFIFSWDDYDRFRKVPAGVDPSFSKYIAMPLTSVPDPEGKFSSYARRFESEFENSMSALNISLEYRYQTSQYTSGAYSAFVIEALQKRQQIAKILISFMSDKGKLSRHLDEQEYVKAYFPIAIYSRFTGSDRCKILDYDGKYQLTYKCLTTGKSDTIDISKTHIVKLVWKVDWPMRWLVERVHFEPGGHDHASPSGSYDVSSVIAREVFCTTPPVFQGYQFVGLHGAGSKMSGSKGDAISPGVLLQIYEPEILKWLYLRRSPTQSFSLAFDTEIYRQYDEFDRTLRTTVDQQKKILSFCGVGLVAMGAPISGETPIPFRQAVALGQITQWDTRKMRDLLRKMGFFYSDSSIESRLARARAWLELYNTAEIISLYEQPNIAYSQFMNELARERIKQLYEFLQKRIESFAELEGEIYEIPKRVSRSTSDIKTAQREFFKDVYNLLIGRDTGPRLSTFLWAIDRSRALRLLEI